MDFVRVLLCSVPRLTGGIFLFGGLIGGVNLWSVYRSGGSFLAKDTFHAPVLLILGLGILIEPRLLLGLFSDPEHPVPIRFKIMGILLIVISGAIGLYLEQVVFKEWKSVPLTEMGR